MKNKLLFGALLIGIANFFTACSDDNGSNPTLIQPTEFKFNTPAYISETIDLLKTNELNLSWSQPQFTKENAPINATYEIQVSPTNSFTVSADEADADESKTLVADYAIVDRTTQSCTYQLSTEDLDKALVKVANWKDEKDVPANQAAYIRINAYVLEGKNKLNAIASNTVQLSTVPYFIMLADHAPIMYYLVGDNIADGLWKDNFGVSNVPMFVQAGYPYDKKTGEGEITYLNYCTTDEWKIQPEDFNWDYGFMGTGSANEAVYRNGEGDKGNIWVEPAGYYLVTVNTGTMECTIKKQDITPTIYDQICIAGSFADSNWGDVDMTPANKTGENHVWCYILTVDEGQTEQIKFKIPDSWDTNWGYGSADGEVNLCGQASNGGKNIGVAEGTWIIMFNDITGDFSISQMPKK